jgi:uncharacterized protein (DUF427 family)
MPREDVWSFPRPPRLEATLREILVVHRGVVIARTREALRVLETSHPPSYYIPRRHVALEHLATSQKRSYCEWKGEAFYFHVTVGADRAANSVWHYPKPSPGFEALAGHLAFFPACFDACLVDGLKATPQEGGFYGGWITPDLLGPFKGAPGSRLW